MASLAVAVVFSVATFGLPSAAHAQKPASADRDQRTIGERYHVEASGTLWNPALAGTIASDSLSLVGSSVDFSKDLGFNRSRIQDFNFVLRPARSTGSASSTSPSPTHRTRPSAASSHSRACRFP